MDIINNALFYLLQLIKEFQDNLGLAGGYALAIVLLTMGIRLILWPLNNTQTRSMKKMQELQPKLKQLQEKFKDSPQQMQAEMMKFYAEHKFNPLAGCLPMLIQLPIFIGLYGMLISPNFLAVAGHETIFGFGHLSQTLTSHAGAANDNIMDVEANDKFVTANTLTVDFDSGTTAEYPIRDARKVLQVNPQPLIPGEPMTITLNARHLGKDGFAESFVKLIKSAQLVMVNDGTKEVETLHFAPTDMAAAAADNPSAQGWTLASTVPTQLGEKEVHKGMLLLIGLYALVTVLYQQVMQSGAAVADNPQAKLMKFMPLMFVGVLFFIPIPAGVMLYLIVTMVMMFLQTLWVKVTDDKAKAALGPSAGSQVVDITPKGA